MEAGAGAGEKGNELQSLLESIKASDDLGERISLLSQLKDSSQIEAVDLGILADYLIVLWEDEADGSASHCTLQRLILQLAMKCMDVDATTCLSQFIVLSSKASSWCAMYLEERTGAIDKLQEENHSITFQQVLLDGLVFASNLISVLTSNHIAKEDTNLMLITETFISVLLDLTKASVIDKKKIHNASAELLKAAQNILEGTRALCTTYSDVSKMLITTKEEISNETGELNFTSLVSRITNHVIRTSYEIGVFAASGGGTHVTLLNLSWKGVVTLLQTNKGVLDESIKLGDIITTLISLALEMLKSASESWSVLTLTTGPSIAEAKRSFLPIKFFLINAVRICNAFPSEALAVQREIIGCALVISNLGLYFSKETRLRAASEALAEFVDPMSFLLLQAVLNPVAMDAGAQCEVFGCLFQNKQDIGVLKKEEPDGLASVFSKGYNCPLLGGVILFLNLLRTSPSLGERTTIELSKYLGNLFNALVDENTYPFVLGLEVPVLENSKSNPQIAWQPMYTFVVQTLKAFLISLAALDAVAWMEVETVLLDNLFHVHFLCVEIATELLSFVLRHAEAALTFQIMENILSLVRLVAPHGLRPKIAHAFNTLLACASSDVVDRIYTLVSNDDKSGIYLQLLREGFPFDSLSDNVKRIAIGRLFVAFNGFMEAYCRDNGGACTDLTGFPVHALASALLFCNLKDSEAIDEKTISSLFKFTNSLTHSYKNAPDDRTRDSVAKLMGSMLDIISETKQLYGYPEISMLVADIHSFFIPKSNANTGYLPSLARFISGLSHMEVPEGNGNPVSTAIWDLNHMLLRERHWAVMHQAVAAFGYYAAHTTCTQLWQFVPDDAALCYDAETGTVTDENRFMSELKAFLEKEAAVSAAVFSGDEFGFLKTEGESLQKKIISCTDSAVPMEMWEQEEAPLRKKRKVPEGFSEGVVLLQRGLKAVRGVFDQTGTGELENEISSHMACLENVISHLVCLSDSQ